jgi:hypothetical protein
MLKLHKAIECYSIFNNHSPIFTELEENNCFGIIIHRLISKILKKDTILNEFTDYKKRKAMESALARAAS